MERGQMINDKISFCLNNLNFLVKYWSRELYHQEYLYETSKGL